MQNTNTSDCHSATFSSPPVSSLIPRVIRVLKEISEASPTVTGETVRTLPSGSLHLNAEVLHTAQPAMPECTDRRPGRHARRDR
jgi:hypothetical protein